MKEVMIGAIFFAVLWGINLFWINFFTIFLQGFLAMVLFLALTEKSGSLEDEIQHMKTILEKQSEKIRILEAKK